MKDYFVYLPDPPRPAIWGCVAKSTGFTRVLPGTVYPAHRHPVDHHFAWSQGRVLQRYQIILISEGSGSFESAATRPAKVDAPAVLLLFPGVWHRYTPDPATGWVEHWIECHGPVFDAALGMGLIQPARALLKLETDQTLRDCFQICHALAREGALANQDLLSTAGLQLLALVTKLGKVEFGVEREIDEIVERAQTLIALRCQDRLDLPALATELGVSYSHLRHSFRARVGVSLKQHYLNSRLEKGRDLLANTPKPLKAIADILGFDSPFHFSNQFKRRFGVSPKRWREELRQRHGHEPPT